MINMVRRRPFLLTNWRKSSCLWAWLHPGKTYKSWYEISLNSCRGTTWSILNNFSTFSKRLQSEIQEASKATSWLIKICTMNLVWRGRINPWMVASLALSLTSKRKNLNWRTNTWGILSNSILETSELVILVHLPNSRGIGHSRRKICHSREGTLETLTQKEVKEAILWLVEGEDSQAQNVYPTSIR